MQLIDARDREAKMRAAGRFDLVVDPLRQTEIGLVGAAVGVTDDRRALEAAREVERGRG
jgi:hypothetical protein